MRAILVGLDGSEDCQPAAELGIHWAKRFGCLLVAIGVVDEPAIRGDQRGGRVSTAYQAVYDQLLTEARHRVDGFLEQFAIRCSDEQVSLKLLEDEGPPCDRILCELQRYDLLILGCKTHFQRTGDRHPCKTLENVLRAASRPIIAAPKSSVCGSGKCVVVAYDGGVQAARALQAFLFTGLADIGPIHVVSVHPESSVEAARIADRAAEFLRFHDLESVCVPMVGSSPGHQLLDYAKQQHAEILVMGAYGQPKVLEFFVGSTTCTALQETSVPLFLYH